MLIGMTTDVSKYQLTQNSHSSGLRNTTQAVGSMMKFFEDALSPVRLTAKSGDRHNIKNSGCHINYIVLQNLVFIVHFLNLK